MATATPMSEVEAQNQLSGVYAAATGMLALCIAAGEDGPARAAAQLVVHFEPPADVLSRLADEQPQANLFHAHVVAAMRELARAVLAGRPHSTQN